MKFLWCQLSKTFYQKFWGQFEPFEAKEVKSEVSFKWRCTDLLTTQCNLELWVMNYWFRNWILKTRSCKFIVNSTFSSQKYFLKVRKGPTFSDTFGQIKEHNLPKSRGEVALSKRSEIHELFSLWLWWHISYSYS